MRVAITGATGNVGTSLVRALARDDRIEEVVGIARRLPQWSQPKTRFVGADVAEHPLEPIFEGADAVVHLAWLIQPSRDQRELARVNLDGTRRVFDAAVAAGVPTLVYASSIGAYSPGPKDRGVDESWPTGGIPTSFYSRHKATTERMLDEIEARHPQLRSVRLRPGLIFKAEAATEIRRYFAGPFLPNPLLRPSLLRVMPRIPRLRVQALHADDVAEAYRLVITDERARGAYNVAADPVIDPDSLAREFGALKLPLPAAAVRALTTLTWKARMQPTPPGWLDMGLGVPIMDTSRIRTELGWTPRWTAMAALRDLLEGMARGDELATPPLAHATGGPARLREFVTTRVGARNP
jgi:nucleoside-diphosphate-sugar epimerase